MSYTVCDKAGIDYSKLIGAINEIISGVSIISNGEYRESSVNLSYPEYTRNNAILVQPVETNHTGNVQIVNGAITTDKYAIVGDRLFNPIGGMVVSRAPDELLGDLLALSYHELANGNPQASLAIVQCFFLMARIYSENIPPSLQMSTYKGIQPYEF